MRLTKKILRRNQNILRYHNRGYPYRSIGKIVHLSHAQVGNIINKLKNKDGGNNEKEENLN